jgi:hypothetical protein
VGLTASIHPQKFRTRVSQHPNTPVPIDLAGAEPTFIDLTGALSAQGVATAFPQIPADGDEIDVLVDSANGTVWRFRYVAALVGLNPWLFVGGSPLSAIVTTQESTASTSLTDLATVGPSIVVPRTGIYTIGMHSGYWAGVAANGALVTPVSPTLGSIAANGLRMISVTGGQTFRNGGFLPNAALTVGETLKLQYAAQVGGTSTFDQRRLSILPSAVT